MHTNSTHTGWGHRSLLMVGLIAVMVFLALSLTIMRPQNVLAAAAVNLDQGSNGKASAPHAVTWQNGNLNENDAHYMEGYSIPYRAIMTGLTAGDTVTITIGYDIMNSSKHAIDYLTSYNRLEIYPGEHQLSFGHPVEAVDPLAGLGLTPSITTTYAIPAPTGPAALLTEFSNLPSSEKLMTLYGGTITNIVYVSQGVLTGASSEATVAITFTVTDTTEVLAWGGHVADSAVWGVGMAATGIQGSPYHMRLKTWTLGNLGNQDRSLKSFAVIPPGTIVVVKHTIGGDGTFNFTTTGIGMTPTPFGITTVGLTGSQTFSNLTTDTVGGSRTITETVPSGWTLTNLTAVSLNHTSTVSVNAGVATVSSLGADDTVTITYTDTAMGTLRIVKNTVGGDGTFNFTVSGGTTVVAAQHITTVSGTGYVEVPVIAGTYHVTEGTLPTGWISNDASMTQDAIVPLNGTGTVTFTNTFVPPGYTHTWGYWMTHSSHGPAPYDDTWALLGEDTTFFLSGTTYYGVLLVNVAGGNAYYQLAHQYVAAELSVLDGASMRADVKTAFDAATALLNVYTPAQIDSYKKGTPAQKAIWTQFNQLASILDEYNNGNMGTPHAP